MVPSSPGPHTLHPVPKSFLRTRNRLRDRHDIQRVANIAALQVDPRTLTRSLARSFSHEIDRIPCLGALPRLQRAHGLRSAPGTRTGGRDRQPVQGGERRRGATGQVRCLSALLTEARLAGGSELFGRQRERFHASGGADEDIRWSTSGVHGHF